MLDKGANALPLAAPETAAEAPCAIQPANPPTRKAITAAAAAMPRHDRPARSIWRRLRRAGTRSVATTP